MNSGLQLIDTPSIRRLRKQLVFSAHLSELHGAGFIPIHQSRPLPACRYAKSYLGAVQWQLSLQMLAT